MLSSVANSLRVLVTLVNHGEIGVSDIGRELDLTGGTVFRLLSTLCEAGFAEQNLENRKYRPGPQVLELANTIRSRTSFIDVAHAELETLMNQSAETVNLGVLRGDNDYLCRLPEMTTAEGIKPPPSQTFAKELDLAVISGHSEDHGEYSPDIACVAVLRRALVAGDR